MLMQNGRGTRKAGPLFNLARDALSQTRPAETNSSGNDKEPIVDVLKSKTLDRTIDYLKKNIDSGEFSLDDRGKCKTITAEMLGIVLTEEGRFVSRVDRDKIVNDVTDEITGYGPIDPFIRDTEVYEVMVNGPHDIYIEKGGRIAQTDVVFRDDDHVRRVIEKIIGPLGRRLDESSPMVDGRLPDGSRVNAIIPPFGHKRPYLDY